MQLQQTSINWPVSCFIFQVIDLGIVIDVLSQLENIPITKEALEVWSHFSGLRLLGVRFLTGAVESWWKSKKIGEELDESPPSLEGVNESLTLFWVGLFLSPAFHPNNPQIFTSVNLHFYGADERLSSSAVTAPFLPQSAPTLSISLSVAWIISAKSW